MRGLSRRALVGGALPTFTGSVASAKGGYIDAHVHVWTTDVERYPVADPSRRKQVKPASFTPEELFAHSRPRGVSRVVLIQMSFYRLDNSYMVDMIERHSDTFRGVAIVDVNAPDVKDQMRALAKRGVRGFRIGPRGRPDTWLDTPGMAAMWECGAEEGLAMCPLMNPDALASLDRMCGRHPDTTVVIDHFARIGADGNVREADLRGLCDLARYPRMHVKLSAFYALGRKQYPYTDLLPMVRRLIEAYGPQRLMWASDSPFQVQNGHTYEGSVELIRDRLDGISAGDREWLLTKTAERVFFSG
ncbi:MAG: amidohydrolase family protein [bacterium]|nr:amidohydrolase family protein [bacterium]